MKTRILKAVFPMLAFVFAITAAFAFAPADESLLTFYSGHKKVGVNCIDVSITCQDDQTSVICKDAPVNGNTLYRYLGPTNCPQQLWKPMP